MNNCEVVLVLFFFVRLVTKKNLGRFCWFCDFIYIS